MISFLVLQSNFSFLGIINMRKEVSVCTWDTEQRIHILERQPLGFGYQKIDEGNGQCHARRKQEIRAISDVGEHVRYTSSNDEIHQPVCCSAYCHTKTSNT